MYRDLVGKPEKIEANNKTWYFQQFCGWNGNLKAVNLYDEDGDFVCEFRSVEEMNDFIGGIQ